MKVLHVIPSMSSVRGGPSAALPVLAESLVRVNVEVHIATTDDDGPGRLIVPLGQPTECRGVTTIYFPRQTRFYAFSWPLTRWLASHVRDYDLVHIHALFSYSTAPAAYFARRSNVPYVVRPLGTINRWGMENRRRRLKSLSFHFIERRILEGAAAVNYTSQQEQSEAHDIGVKTTSVVIPLGTDLSSFEKLPPPTHFLRAHPQFEGKHILLYLSRLDPIKGLELLLPAFKHLRQEFPSAVLALAGDGEPVFVHEVRRMIRDLDLTDSVFLLGFLRNGKKQAALSAATAFVLPSHSENFGVAAVEALAAGLPVIITEHVGIARDVAAREAGLVVPARVDAIASALQRIMSEPDLRVRLAANGRELAHQCYSAEATAIQQRALYADVIERSRGGLTS